MKDRIVDCSSCKEEFEVNALTRRLEDDSNIEETYFICPHCGGEFNVCYSDPSIREQQRKLRALYARLPRTKTMDALDELNKRIDEAKEQLGKMMEELKQTINQKRT
ncbi:hypothetical protein [Paenibacillus agilis]|uniref:Transglycosylase n=1 Tax=Paenibacillus agilis TaxID=3020863 RepID=A0A559IZH9_9BACL|nr:hypothetical protein [Paenibacillus agilis]TVX93035.1 hypothetical protein FPZ44_08170 [Paenibacillus agilis]